MATFKDIARVSGVSYGTVSNVLNGRGNVSSDKIIRVHRAAEQLGYTGNQGARLLRKGSSKLLAAVLPNMFDRQYTEFYASFNNYAESRGYKTALYVHGDAEGVERALAGEIRSSLAAGAAVISALHGQEDPYRQAGFKSGEVLMVEQRPFPQYDYIGFDYALLGREMGKRAGAYEQVALITEGGEQYTSARITEAFTAQAALSPRCHVQHYVRNALSRKASLALDVLSASPAPQAVFTTKVDGAQTTDNIRRFFFGTQPLDIYTVSPLCTMPVADYCRYELNYRLLGKEAARMLIERVAGEVTEPPRAQILPGTGFRSWNPGKPPLQGALTMLTLDSPTAGIVKNMARMYTHFTGVPIHVAVFPYDGVHEILSGLNSETPFDIIRLDATWMSWFGPRIYEPLGALDADVKALDARFLPGLLERFGGSGGKLYAIPETPSSQMLFYRRDLFEDTALQRLYKEKTGETLRPPQSFAEYNRVARFFTRRENPASPVRYGATLTLGNTGVAATEFLTRYYALSHDLFDKNDRIQLTSAKGTQALEELVALRECVSPVHSAWWRDTTRGFAQGDVAMTVLYSNYASELLGRDSRVNGRIGFAMVPGGNPLWGGGAIGVCRYSRSKALAFHFLKWLCGEEVSTAMTLLGSVSPCRATYDNYQVIDTYPWLAMARECFEKARVNRLPHRQDTKFDERRFLSILGLQVINAINGTQSVPEALRSAARLYDMSF